MMNLACRRLHVLVPLVVATFFVAACSSATSSESVPASAAPAPAVSTTAPVEETVEPAAVEPQAAAPTSVPESTSVPVASTSVASTPAPATAAPATFVAEVWADNWFALYVNGVLVGEDSVPITTERSFNMETIQFTASYPLTIAIEAKDFKETDSGIEYIGAQNQQMGDGGLIAQFTDLATGEIVAVTDVGWATYVTHRAPLNKDCERDANPNVTCLFEINDTPDGWASATFSDAGWGVATEWSEAAVSPKDGYDQVSWDQSARLIWGTDLETDNTILLRTTVTGTATLTSE